MSLGVDAVNAVKKLSEKFTSADVNNPVVSADILADDFWELVKDVLPFEYEHRNALSREDATKKLNENVSIAYKAIREAEEIAKRYDIVFSFDLSYGMGGTYYPNYKYDDSYNLNKGDSGWLASSHSC